MLYLWCGEVSFEFILPNYVVRAIVAFDFFTILEIHAQLTHNNWKSSPMENVNNAHHHALHKNQLKKRSEKKNKYLFLYPFFLFTNDYRWGFMLQFSCHFMSRKCMEREARNLKTNWSWLNWNEIKNKK